MPLGWAVGGAGFRTAWFDHFAGEASGGLYLGDVLHRAVSISPCRSLAPSPFALVQLC